MQHNWCRVIVGSAALGALTGAFAAFAAHVPGHFWWDAIVGVGYFFFSVLVVFLLSFVLHANCARSQEPDPADECEDIEQAAEMALKIHEPPNNKAG